MSKTYTIDVTANTPIGVVCANVTVSRPGYRNPFKIYDDPADSPEVEINDATIDGVAVNPDDVLLWAPAVGPTGVKSTHRNSWHNWRTLSEWIDTAALEAAPEDYGPDEREEKERDDI